MFDSGMDMNGMPESGFDGFDGFGGGGGMPMDDLLRAFMSQQGGGGRSHGFQGFHPYQSDGW